MIPKGRSLNRYTQVDMNLLVNHINSVRRAKFNNVCPYELANSDDMKYMMALLDLRIIPSDEVHLKPDLF